MNRQTKGYIYALAAVLFWSTAATAFKLTLRQIDLIGLLFYSSLVAASFLLVLLLVRGQASLLRNQFRSGNRAGLGRSLLAGFLNPFFYYLVLFNAYSRLPAQEAQPLNFTWPVVLAILAAVIFKERIRPASVAALLISFTGVLVISTRGDILGFRPADPPGALLAVGSAFVWAAYWLINMQDKRDEVLKLLMGFGSGFLLIWLFFIVQVLMGRIDNSGGEGITWLRPWISFLPRLSGPALAGCVYIGLFEMGVTFVLWLRALRLSETTAKVSNLIYLAPFLSLIFIRFLVGEKILSSSLIGLVFIMGGVILQNRASR
jgi:drug/metabolite transporter (DMT)-like permease